MPKRSVTGTDIPTDEGKLYLASVLDLCGRRLLACPISQHPDAELASDAIKMAAAVRGGRAVIDGVIFHSDRGSTYTANDFMKSCRQLGGRQSMGRVGSCFDNAASEAFFSTLEHEVLSRHHFATKAQAREVITAWCYDFYNTRRRHSSAGLLPPVDYEKIATIRPEAAYRKPSRFRGKPSGLFGDEYFADLFKRSTRGRPTVPARVVATVMLLQAYEGLSDREACDRLAFDLRWKAASGLAVGAEAFHPTVLVGMRNRLRASERPRRLFDDVNAAARAAGLLRGRRRVIDSTPLLDAVVTQDTVIQLRAAMRKVLSVADRADPQLAAEVRTALTRDDDYASLGKPPCDWDDPKAREALVDALVRDAQAALAALDGHELDGPLAEAADLLALVAGQDVEAGEDGVFRIARRVARDRLISTVDVEARHGHKSRARTFDGYKSHFGVDPDDELITNVAVTAANRPDREVIDELLDQPSAGALAADTESEAGEPVADTATDTDEPSAGTDELGSDTGNDSEGGTESEGFEVYGDSAYAGGATLDEQAARGHDMRTKVPPVRNANGYSKDRFTIDLQAATVTCPAHHTVAIGGGRRHRSARFGQLCQSCPLRADCTKARAGRVITIHPHEAALQHAKARQKDPAWQQAYRENRPVVERKISHFTHRPWGGRKARCRGSARILTDILTRASVINLARLATLGLHQGPTGWAIA